MKLWILWPDCQVRLINWCLDCFFCIVSQTVNDKETGLIQTMKLTDNYKGQQNKQSSSNSKAPKLKFFRQILNYNFAQHLVLFSFDLRASKL